MLSVEGRAISPAYQGNGLGTLALHDTLQQYDDVRAAASITRNPAIPRLMAKAFHTVSPDLNHPNPLRPFVHDDRIRTLTEMYARHTDTATETLPFAVDRYQGGLYGGVDPGQNMIDIPEIAGYPENGIVMIAIDRKDTV